MRDPYFCTDENRRELAGLTPFNGIDYLEVVDYDAPVDELRQRTLLVFCLKPVAALDRSNVRITGGVRVRRIAVLWAHPASAIPAGALDAAEDPAFYTSLPTPANVLVVRTDVYGDYSTYELALVNSGATEPHDSFDPQLAAVEFSFKVECPSEFDCAPVAVHPPPQFDEPEIDYLAKDYESFRRLMLDRMSVLMPQWSERNPADVQIMLAEALAYVADQLSYYQDAVATEAYLGTARQRISVRRHARLLDYRLHEGAAARTWVVFEVSEDVLLPERTLLLGRGAGGPVIDPDPAKPDLHNALSAGPVLFETMHAAQLRPGRHVLDFYTWGNLQCCLPAGSTSAALIDSDPPAQLQAGDILLMEEVRDPSTGATADADGRRRHTVRLVEVSPAVDEVTGESILIITWHSGDALPFSLCLSALVRQGSQAEQMAAIAVARANVVLAEQGHTIAGEPLVPAAAPSRGAYRPKLQTAPLAFSGPPFSAHDPQTPAAAALDYTPEKAAPGIVAVHGEGLDWLPLYDLLASDRFSANVVVETDNDRTAWLRFGDGLFGRRPSPGSTFTATYRTGGGASGNIGAEVLTRVVFGGPGIVHLRNPLAARGGADPEPLERARLHAPDAFRTQDRAVTASDYATMAQRSPGVQKAAAMFRWTGSWRTVFVAADRLGGQPIDAPFKTALSRFLDRYRMAGSDLEIKAPVFVPLDIVVDVCVKPGYFRSQVKQALLEAFGSGLLPGGGRGFFHPDNFTFGSPLYLSQLYAAVLQVAGVHSAVVSTFRRWGRPANGELAAGVLPAAFMEVLRLDNSPDFPENGRIDFVMKGGT